MSPHGKVDLGAKAESMLASWPAPASDDAAWEARAAKIVAAAVAAPRADDATLAALFAKPALESEPGEVQSSKASAAVSARSASGEKSMSDSNADSPAKPSTPVASKRPSLKELAARASQASASGVPSMRPASTPPPPDTVLPDNPSRASSPTPSVAPPKASIPPPSRPIEAGKEDSGRVDLNAITQAATPEQVAAAAVAKPATHDLVSDAPAEEKPATTGDGKVKDISEARAKKTKKKAAAAKPTEADKPAEVAEAAAEPVKKAETESSGGGAKFGIVIAILGLAAAGVMVWKNKQEPTPAPVAAVVQEKPAEQPLAVAANKVEEAPKPASTGLSIDSLPEATPAESAKAAAGTKLAAAPTTADTGFAPPPAPTPEVPTALPTATAPTGKPGDLSSAMAQAVGASGEKPVNADDATPAAAKTGSQTIPEQPSQGASNAAIRAVLPGAKACVAGADEPSTATVTFSSSGTVSSVSVSGWASKNGKAECVKAALKGANVGPFAKPSYTMGVPIRP